MSEHPDVADALSAADDVLTSGADEQPGTTEPLEEEAGLEEAADALEIARVELRPALEAVLMVADQPLDHLTLAAAVGHPPDDVLTALHDLAADYTAQDRGFDLRDVAGGWRYYTREKYAAVVEQFVLEGQQARLTQAALETLAVVAYQQPVSRSRVAAVRGVNVDGVMRTLISRGLVEEAGQDPTTTAVLYRTTRYFLERIGVTSLDELPELAPYLPDMADLDDPDERESLPEPAGDPGPQRGMEPAGEPVDERVQDKG